MYKVLNIFLLIFMLCACLVPGFRVGSFIIHEAELQDETIAPYEIVKYPINNTKYVCKVFGDGVEKFETKDSISILFRKPGEYHVVITSSNRKGVDISYGTVVVGGADSPDEPTVENSLKDKVHNAVLSVVPEEYRSICKSMAVNYREVASKNYTSEDEMFVALKEGNRKVIQFDGSDMRKEAVFTTFLCAGGTLDRLLIELYPDGIKNWGPVLLEIADGLE